MTSDHQNVPPSEQTPIQNLLQKAKGAMPLIYLVVTLLALRWTVVEPYVVPTPSMEPTLKMGDRLYALKCAYDIRFPFTDWTLLSVAPVKRGDVILFIAPHEPDKTYVKRAVGLPGDEIELRSGVIYVNGVAVEKTIFPDRSIMYDIQDAENKSLYLEDLGGVKHYTILDNFRPSYRSHPPPEEYLERYPHQFFGGTKVPPGHVFAVGDNRDHSFDSRGWGFVPFKNLKGRAMFIWFSLWEGNIRFERIGTLIQ